MCRWTQSQGQNQKVLKQLQRTTLTEFTPHIEKLQPYFLITSVGELSSPATRNFQFKYIYTHRSTWTRGWGWGAGKPIIAKLGTELNPQKWVQLEEIVQKWCSHQEQQLSFQNKFLKAILTRNARNPAILYSCRKVYKRDSQPSSRTVTSPLLNVSFAGPCLFTKEMKGSNES